MKNSNSYILRIYDKDKLVYRVGTKNKQRFRNKIDDYNWKDGLTANVRVNYGRTIDSDGEMATFDNKANCRTKEEAHDLLEYFDEMSIADWQ